MEVLNFDKAVEIEAEMSGLRAEILLYLERMVGNFPVFTWENKV